MAELNITEHELVALDAAIASKLCPVRGVSHC